MWIKEDVTNGEIVALMNNKPECRMSYHTRAIDNQMQNLYGICTHIHSDRDIIACCIIDIVYQTIF